MILFMITRQHAYESALEHVLGSLWPSVELSSELVSKRVE